MSYNYEIQSNNEELENILENINNLPDAGSGDAVLYVEQTLTETQKAQARENIDAMAVGELQQGVNEALAQAKASGDFKGDDGTSVTVKSVSESTADGGSNVVTFSDGKTLTVKNGSKGSKGDKGDTPVKGTDYFTEAEKAAMVQEVIDAIGLNIIGEVDNANNILITADLPAGTYTLRYENSDGSTTEIGTLTVGSVAPSYTNLADPTSSDWLTNKRINSSKNVVDVTEAQRGDKTVVVTNMIPISGVTKFHVKGLDIINNLVNGSSTQNYGRYYTYNSSGTLVSAQLQPSTDAVKQYFTTADYDSSVTIIDVPGLVSYVGYANQSHVRLGGILTGAAEDVIITADEKITGSNSSTPSEPNVSYTNQIKISTDTDGSIYNGTGFKSGVYISSNDGSIGTRNGISTTGFIPIKKGDVVRLQNVGLVIGASNASDLRVATYNSSKQFLKFVNASNTYALIDSNSGVKNSTNELVEFTINGENTLFVDDAAYMRICTDRIADDSVITINEPIE